MGIEELSESSVRPYASEVIDAPLENEMRKSYLDYAMSVIVGRALPDARDGLKPVHRRVMHSMNELGNEWNKPYKKSARIVGDTIGKYHPHGDNAVYDTMVRMAQTFSLRYPLIDGQGNFGSVDGDNAAAMRYTEVRLSKLSHQLIRDIEKDTVDFGPNYDGNEKEPLVLPTRFPNLLLNGSEGIAVGMATKIPPHNLTELIEGCLLMLRNEAATVDDLIKIIPAPDFPTGGIICGLSGAAEAYRTGKGSVTIRAKTHFEEADKGSKHIIVVDELPYQVNKKKLQENIAELVKTKSIEGITHVQDESDKSGMRLVIELRRGELPDVVLNQLFKKTEMQISFSLNMVALVEGRPQILNLHDCLSIFLSHRREVIVRRTLFELRATRMRGHVLEGYAVALSNMDEIVETIRAAKDPHIAKESLLNRVWAAPLVKEMLSKTDLTAEETRSEDMVGVFGLNEHGDYKLSSQQAHEILQLRLQRLTGLEQDKIISEFKEILVKIKDLINIITYEDRVTAICKDELISLKEEFGDERKSEIVLGTFNIEDEDLIPRRDVMVTVSRMGYVKRSDLDVHNSQKRGGRGKSATDLKDTDAVKKVFVANSHDILLCFTSAGRVLPIKVYALPEGSRHSRGRPLVNYLNLVAGETVAELLPVKDFEGEQVLVFATKLGMVKRTKLGEFKTIRAGGLIAIDLNEGDSLVSVQANGNSGDVMLFTDNNRVNRFNSNGLRLLSRTAKGVKSMRMDDKVNVIGMLIPDNDQQTLLTVTDNGYAKRTTVGEYRKASRGSVGVKAIPTDEKIGNLMKVLVLTDGMDILGITTSGVMIRVSSDEVRKTSRLAKGVKLLKLDEGQILVDVCLATEVAETDEIDPKIEEMTDRVEGRISDDTQEGDGGHDGK